MCLALEESKTTACAFRGLIVFDRLPKQIYIEASNASSLRPSCHADLKASYTSRLRPRLTCMMNTIVVTSVSILSFLNASMSTAIRSMDRSLPAATGSTVSTRVVANACLPGCLSVNLKHERMEGEEE
jgi:hypothetical protein